MRFQRLGVKAKVIVMSDLMDRKREGNNSCSKLHFTTGGRPEPLNSIVYA